MLRRLISIAVAAATPAAAATQESPAADRASAQLSIAAGETVTARIADGGFILVGRALGEASGDVPEGTVRFSFTDMGGMTMLQVENGTGRPFEYRARMFSGSRSARTSTCTVLPGMSGFEQWPHPIDRLEISEPELGSASQAAIRCR